MWYLVCILSGIIIGLIGGVLIDKDVVVRYIVRKIKIKNSRDISDVVVIESIDKKIEELKKKKKEERKKARLQRRKERKENK
jgi:hypothetical protein